MLLAVVLCWVDRCLDSWALLGLFSVLRVTQNTHVSAAGGTILSSCASCGLACPYIFHYYWILCDPAGAGGHLGGHTVHV